MPSLSDARKAVIEQIGAEKTEAIERFVVGLIRDQIAMADQSLLIYNRIAGLEKQAGSSPRKAD